MLNKRDTRFSVDNIVIYRTANLRNQPHEFCVQYRQIAPEGSISKFTYFSTTFAIRNHLGNPTDIGRKMGIKCRDKRISLFSPQATVIHDYLHRLAWKYARSLVFGGANVEDRTGYIKNSSERQLEEKFS